MSTVVSILIPIFNGLDYTKKCLHELYAAIDNCGDPSFRFEVVLIDDGSTDGSADWVKQYYPSVHLAFGDGSLWWSGGINRGTQLAIETLKTDYVLWWNNDIYMADDYFDQLAKLLSTRPKNKVFGSKIYFAEQPDVVWSFGGEFVAKYGNRHMVGIFHKDGPAYSIPRLVDWLPGMGTVFPVEVIDKIGPLNQKDFPQYHGDTDYTYRAKLAGFDIEVRPELKIWNYTENSGTYHSESFKKLWNTMFDIKSPYNVRIELLFYKYYGTSYRVYFLLLKKYGQYIGGFFKWRLLKLLGIERKLGASTNRQVVED